MNATISGRVCEMWNNTDLPVVMQHYGAKNITYSEEHNYCRNPTLEEKPWCFVEGEEREGSYMQEACSIPPCGRCHTICQA